MSNDTQHYTNLEIFHSLVPKLKAAVPDVNWDVIEKDGYKHFKYFIDAIAIAYRSGYGRGQKGRSFLIGEKKEVKAVKGAKVCWFSDDHDEYYPDKKGTVGTIDCVDCDGDLWVYWPLESQSWCCTKAQCLLIDTNVKNNLKKGDKIVYLGTSHGFLRGGVWPDRVATGVVDCAGSNEGMVRWDNPTVVANHFYGRTHVWFEDIVKVIPWD